MIKTYVLDPQCPEVENYYSKPDKFFTQRLKWRREHQKVCQLCADAAQRHAECEAKGCQE